MLRPSSKRGMSLARVWLWVGLCQTPLRRTPLLGHYVRAGAGDSHTWLRLPGVSSTVIRGFRLRVASSLYRLLGTLSLALAEGCPGYPVSPTKGQVSVVADTPDPEVAT